MPGLESVENEGLEDGELRVYIAGPYTNGDWGENIKLAIGAAQDVLESGHCPFLPHTMTGLWSILYWNKWIEFDLKWLEVCDALIRLPGDSPGADTEVKFAEQEGIEVYNSVNEFVEQNYRPQ